MSQTRCPTGTRQPARAIGCGCAGSVVVISVITTIEWKYYELKGVDAKLTVPEILVALGSTALGALAGLLAPQAIGGK
jgi:hypothetical protein